MTKSLGVKKDTLGLKSKIEPNPIQDNTKIKKLS